ncbi:MAG: hypothetical protein AVDCRST_MAG32-66 [uncultured Nocardioides sp.]|uniref:Uncharacterized protein n=1 Tax=uncultured Nocardioides sp. TaxID=198441 RepID=A0A6J4MST5_9ACTN|nr:MAG: hypothetical protein AVDCRST_MAG32-66 [uncultured Nocardioides sp.]
MPHHRPVRAGSASGSRFTRRRSRTERTGLGETEGPARRAPSQQHRGRDDEQEGQRSQPRHQHERRHHHRQAQRSPDEVPGDGAAGEHGVGLGHAVGSPPTGPTDGVADTMHGPRRLEPGDGARPWDVVE